MLQRLFAVHPLLGVAGGAAVVSLVGCFEYFVLRNRRAAYITWGFVAFCAAAAVMVHLIGAWLS